MKKLIIILTSIAVIAGGTFGAYKYNEKRKLNKTIAKVTPVSFMADNYYGGDIELSGMIASGNIQKVVPDNQKLVEKMLVNEGDHVKKGDPLLKYDIVALELDVKQKENAVAVAESDIKVAEKELKKLKNLKSSESMPKPPEPTDPPPKPIVTPTEPATEAPVKTKSTIKNTADSISGDGSQGNPLLFNCVSDTVVKAEVLTSLKESGGVAEFVVYEDGYTALYKWRISGSKLNDEQLVDWVVGENVVIDANGNVTVNYSETVFGSFTVLKEVKTVDVIEDFYDDYVEDVYEPISDEDFYESIPRNYPEDYIYTKAELAKMVSDKEIEIKRLEINKKSAEVTYKIALEQKDSGNILARIDGIVTSVNDVLSIAAGEPCITVEGEGGLTVKGYVGEMNLDKVTPGSFVNVMSWETGEMAQAEVTEINMDPVSYSSYAWNENPNSSTYEFTAVVNDGMTAMSADMSVSITLPSQEESSGIYIPKVYVRNSDDGYYVYKADENSLLKKQYVKVGKTVYGYQIQVLDGLTTDDKICFPYGKNIKDGIKTEDTDQVLW